MQVMHYSMTPDNQFSNKSLGSLKPDWSEMKETWSMFLEAKTSLIDFLKLNLPGPVEVNNTAVAYLVP